MAQTDSSEHSSPRSNLLSSGSLTLASESGADTFVLHAEGELDVSNVDVFEDCLRAAEASEAGHVLVDLNDLSFMDSAGLRALLMASRRVRRNSRRLSVRATGAVRRIIELTGMATYLALGEAGNSQRPSTSAPA